MIILAVTVLVSNAKACNMETEDARTTEIPVLALRSLTQQFFYNEIFKPVRNTECLRGKLIFYINLHDYCSSNSSCIKCQSML